MATTKNADALEALANRDDVMETVPQETAAQTVPTGDAVYAGGTVEVTLELASGIAFTDDKGNVSYVNAERGQRVKVTKDEADRLKSLGAVQA